MGICLSRMRRRILSALVAHAAVLFVVAQNPARAQDKNPLAQDPSAAKLGEFEFRANCAFCHGLGARGGGRGPDLTRAQKKHGNADADLFRTINEGVPGTAMPPNGATQQGVGVNEDSFTLQMLDMREQLHLFEKDKLRSLEKSRESLMPKYDEKTLPEKDLQDIVAYLLSLGSK